MAFADTARLAVELDLDNSDYQRDIKRSTASTKTFGKQVDKTTKSVSRMDKLKAKAGKGGILGGLMPGIGAGVGIAAVTAGLGVAKQALAIIKDATAAAKEEDAAIATLTKSLEENSEGWDGNIERVEERIALNQRLRFGDAEQRAALQSLVAITKDEAEAFDVLATSMNLARLKGITLKTSVELLGKVAAGQMSSLSRYGIILEKGATKAEAFAQINAMAAGQAEAWADSAAGVAEGAAIAWGDAMESLGRIFMGTSGGVDELSEAVALRLDKAFTDALVPIENVKDALGDIQDFADMKIEDFVPDLGLEDLPQELQDAGKVLTDAAGFIFNPVGMVPGAIAQIVGDNYDAAADVIGIRGPAMTHELRARGWMAGAAMAEGVSEGAGATAEPILPKVLGIGKALNPRDVILGIEKQLKAAISAIDAIIADPSLVNRPRRRIERLFEELGARMPAAANLKGRAGPMVQGFIAATGNAVSEQSQAMTDNFTAIGITAKDGFLLGAGVNAEQFATLWPAEAETVARNEGVVAGGAWAAGFNATVTSNIAVTYPPYQRNSGTSNSNSNTDGTVQSSNKDTSQGITAVKGSNRDIGS